MECWICRNPHLNEPLVQPCACRGSMAGVHASCVQVWVDQSRQLEIQPGVPHPASFDAPHCPVCKYRYGGRTQRPGPKKLARSLVESVSRQLCLGLIEAARFSALAVLLVQYSMTAEDREAVDEGMLSKCPSLGDKLGRAFSLTSAAPNIIAALLWLFLLQKALVLIVSLPLGRLPPRGRVANLFFTPEAWIACRVLAEILAAVFILGCACFRGELSLKRLLPVVAFAVVPFLRVLSFLPMREVLKEVGLLVYILCCMPVAFVAQAVRFVVVHRRSSLNVLNGHLHLATGLVAMTLCLVYRSRRPAAALFLSHSILLALALVERCALRRLSWRPGGAWWYAVLIAVEAVSLALDCKWITLVLLLGALRCLQMTTEDPRWEIHPVTVWFAALLLAAEAGNIVLGEMRGHAPRVTWQVVSAVVWLALMTLLACAVNSRYCLRKYRAWQRRHATYVLCVDQARGGREQAPEPRAPEAFGAPEPFPGLLNEEEEFIEGWDDLAEFEDDFEEREEVV